VTGFSASVNAGEPAWTPDGQQIVYQGIDTDFEIVRVPLADTSARVFLTSNTFQDRYPKVSPDGTRVAYVEDIGSRQRVTTINTTDGGAPRTLTFGFARFPRLVARRLRDRLLGGSRRGRLEYPDRRCDHGGGPCARRRWCDELVPGLLAGRLLHRLRTDAELRVGRLRALGGSGRRFGRALPDRHRCGWRLRARLGDGADGAAATRQHAADGDDHLAPGGRRDRGGGAHDARRHRVPMPRTVR
jgi:hypothetical protein